MPEYFRNDSGFPIDIPYFDLRIPAGALFTVPDEDNGSLYNDTAWFTATDAAGNPLLSTALLAEDGSPLLLETGDYLTT